MTYEEWLALPEFDEICDKPGVYEVISGTKFKGKQELLIVLDDPIASYAYTPHPKSTGNCFILRPDGWQVFSGFTDDAPITKAGYKFRKAENLVPCLTVKIRTSDDE